MNRSILLVFLIVSCLATGPFESAFGLRIPVAGLHLETEGKLEGLYVGKLQSSSPDEDPQGRLRLRVGSDLASWVRLQTALTATAGGTPQSSRGVGTFDLNHTLQDLSPSLDIEEAYADFYLDDLDVRAGLQKFAWGRLDAVQPNDLLNPERFYDPVLEEENDRKIGVPALSATAYLPASSSTLVPESLRLTGVWVPIVVPFRFPDVDERWYPPLARVPRQSVSDGFTVQNESRFRNGRVPARTPGHGAGAARLAGFFHGADFAVYYFDGYDTEPSLDASARGFVTFRPLNPGCVPPADPDCFDARSEIDIFPVFQRIRALGADVAYNFFGATVRAEAAWVRNRLFPRAVRDIVASQEVDAVGILLTPGEEQEVPIRLDAVNVRRDGVEWGLGGDYLFFGNTFVLVQMNQTAVLDNDADLLISDTETRFATTIRRSFLADRLETELVGVYGVQGVYGLASPRVTYDFTDFLQVRVGYVLIEGHEGSVVGQYKRNDQAYVRVRLSF